MDIINPNPNALLDAINAANNLTLDYTAVSLEISTLDEDYTSEAGLGNTVVRVVANRATPFEGEAVVTYDRLLVSELHDLLGGVLSIPRVATSVHEAIGYLAQDYGVVLNTDDFADAELQWEDGSVSFTLEALPQAIAWKGSATFTSNVLPEALSSYLSETTLSGYDVKVVGDGRYYGEGLVYGRDFSAEQALLVSLHENYNIADLVDMLNELTSITWSEEDDPDLVGSLYNSTLVYGGLNSGVDVANPNYKYVTIIALRDDSNVVTGNLILHYNDEEA